MDRENPRQNTEVYRMYSSKYVNISGIENDKRKVSETLETNLIHSVIDTSMEYCYYRLEDRENILNFISLVIAKLHTIAK